MSMNKDYLFKILYDCGVKEEYKCIGVDDIAFAHMMDIFSQTFFKNAQGVVQLPNDIGGVITIDVSKVIYVDVTDITTNTKYLN